MTDWRWAVAAAVLLGSCGSTSSEEPIPAPVQSPISGPSTVARQMLPPARSLPVIALCSQPLTTDQSGSAVPLMCNNGALNVLAWQYFAPLAPRVLGAGATASFKTAQNALCNDWIHGATSGQARSAYELAAAYYGWSFTTDPTITLDSGCA